MKFAVETGCRRYNFGLTSRIMPNRFRPAIFLLAVLASPAALAYPASPDVERFVGAMAEKHAFDPNELRRTLDSARRLPSVLRAISTPAGARPWPDYRDSFVNERRIEGGVRFWRQYAGALARASREYGVPEEVIVATIGVETVYGKAQGSFRVLDALATLAFDYPPRADFFRSELEQYFLLVREEGRDPAALRGSYAGALGIPQFMPSSFRRYAVDFDGDGSRDIWEDAIDAVGSVANYYRSFGWNSAAPVVIPAQVNGDRFRDFLDQGAEPRVTVADLRAAGVTPASPLADDVPAILFRLDGDEGPEYYLGLRNFYVITRYNRSFYYAMTVHQLAQEIAARRRERLPGADGEPSAEPRAE